MHKRVINVFHARVCWTHVCGLRYFSEVILMKKMIQKSYDNHYKYYPE